MQKALDILALLIVALTNTIYSQKIIERQINFPNYTGTILGFNNSRKFLPHGPTQSYNSFTKIETSGSFYKGLPDKQWVQTVGGKSLATATYKRGQLHGTTTKYYNNGKIAAIENYSEGKLHGVSRAFDRSGNFLAEMEWQNGEIMMYKGKNGETEKMKEYDCRDGEFITIDGKKEKIKYRAFCAVENDSMRCFTPCDLFKMGVKGGLAPEKLIIFFEELGKNAFSKGIAGYEHALAICAGRPNAISVPPNISDRVTSVSAIGQSLAGNRLSDHVLSKCTNQSSSSPGPDPTNQQQSDQALKEEANRLAAECENQSRVNPIAQAQVVPFLWKVLQGIDVIVGVGGAAWDGATSIMDVKVENYEDGDIYRDSDMNTYVTLDGDPDNLKYYVSKNINAGTTTVSVKYNSSKCNCEIQQTDTYDTQTGQKLSSTSTPTTMSLEGSLPTNWEPKDTKPALNIVEKQNNDKKKDEKQTPSTNTQSPPSPKIKSVDPEMTASSCISLKVFVSYCNSQNWRDPKCVEFLRVLDRCPPSNSNVINPGPDGSVNISCRNTQMTDEQRAEQECKQLGMIAVPVEGGKLDCKQRDDIDLISKAKSRFGPCGPEMRPRPGQPCEPHKKVPTNYNDSKNSSPQKQIVGANSVTLSTGKVPVNDSSNLVNSENIELSKLNLYEEEFDNSIKKSKIGIVMFYQPSSNAAKKMMPILMKLQSESGQKGYSIYIINSDENPSLSTKNNIGFSPSFMFFKDGKKEGGTTVGALSEKDLAKKINKLF